MRLPCCRPLLPGILEERHIPLAVRPHIVGSVISLLSDDIPQPYTLHTSENRIGALRVFEGGLERSVFEFGAVVEAMIGAKYREHERSSRQRERYRRCSLLRVGNALL
ncbi:hypothetical protein D3C81_1216070 [compost metagenome]